VKLVEIDMSELKELSRELNLPGIISFDEIVNNQEENVTFEPQSHEEILEFIKNGKNRDEENQTENKEFIHIRRSTPDDFKKILTANYEIIKVLENEECVDKNVLKNAYSLLE